MTQGRAPVLVVGGALLVRPDGFVAWRSAAPAADPAAELDHALRAILGRDPPAG
jgi:hypothetical protein